MRSAWVVLTGPVCSCIQLYTGLFFVAIFIAILRRRQPEIPQPAITPPPPATVPETSPPSSQQDDIAIDYHVPRLPYNEDTIVALISDIYHIYLQLNYIDPSEFVWAPLPDGHAINQTLCEELHLDPAVISLMKRLPYPLTPNLADDIPFMPLSRMFVYLQDDQIRAGRDPDRWGFEEPRLDFLLPHEIALCCETDQGIHIILDTKENTIRVWDFDDPPPEDDNGNDYRKLYPHHAPTYLASYINKLHSLEIIPIHWRGHRGLWDKHYTGMYPKIKKTLQEQYGWPYDFREAEWKAASKDTFEQLIHFG
ncbi:hypothetical protein BO78DRAFT_440486 [Aspergillus sclerotiicarbonarius CBS 121057]|uniref:Uncharacterized protein n=1 Tax=Aspergillus sclerotiicarbonarius (strain CBS 121057 / IBT 28362) TaxID=1448318 RepID=A0A319EE89_ASPSB|nr:hypothetical protein BO78DRAFT_440486 [Aspergillus sclerotiicarbonarius CBS 121057]